MKTDTLPLQIAESLHNFVVADEPSLSPEAVIGSAVQNILLSIGEAFYSPRLYEYTAAIAPKGQEASYMAMSSLPFFLAKLAVGPLSGVLLARFCPATGPRHSEALWLIIGLSTMIAPVGLFLFQRFIRVHEAGRDD